MTSAKKSTRKIDWNKVRDQLSKSGMALDQAQQISPERARTLLEERARVIARVPSQALDQGALLEVVTFALGNELYAIETVYVREVLRLREYTPLPGTPDYLVGITNLRGHILSIFDLRIFFGLIQQNVSDQTRILVLGQERIEFGVLAERVDEVSVVRIDELRESPESVTGVVREHIRGVTADSLILLDGSVLLKDPRLFIDLGEKNPDTKEI